MQQVHVCTIMAAVTIMKYVASYNTVLCKYKKFQHRVAVNTIGRAPQNNESNRL